MKSQVVKSSQPWKEGLFLLLLLQLAAAFTFLLLPPIATVWCRAFFSSQTELESKRKRLNLFFLPDSLTPFKQKLAKLWKLLNFIEMAFEDTKAPRHIVWKLLKMSHLNVWIWAFSTNCCPIKTDLSGNTVWPQASGFQKVAKLDYFRHF